MIANQYIKSPSSGLGARFLRGYHMHAVAATKETTSHIHKKFLPVPVQIIITIIKLGAVAPCPHTLKQQQLCAHPDNDCKIIILQ